MAAAMAVPALAEEEGTTTDNNNTSVDAENQQATIPVHGTYKGPSEVISVDVSWDAMDFIYTNASQGTWNPTTHKYENPTTAGWSWNKPEGTSDTKTKPEIKLSNHSNVGVKAAFGFVASTDITGLTGSFTGLTDENAFTLTRALENTDPSAAPSKATAFSLSGDGITGENVALGNITVTISKDDSTPDTPTNPGVAYNSFSELQTAITQANSGDTITLGADIIDTESGDDNPALEITSDKNIVLDLNGHTMSSQSTESVIHNEGTLTIKNGTVIGSNEYNVISNVGSLTADKLEVTNENGGAIKAFKNSTSTNLTHCTLYSGKDSTESALVLCADARIADCSITNIGAEEEAICFLRNTDGDDTPYTLTIGGNTTVEKYITAESACKIVVEADSNFTPADHIDTSAYNTVQDAETGIWTITRIE